MEEGDYSKELLPPTNVLITMLAITVEAVFTLYMLQKNGVQVNIN